MSTKLEVKVPDIGDFEGVEIIELLVSKGDAVDADQGLMTLETDKAAMDVPAPQAGTVLELKVAVGDKVSQGDVVAVMEIAGDDGESGTQDAESGKPDQQTDDAESEGSGSQRPASSVQPPAEGATVEAPSTPPAKDPYDPSASLPPIDEKGFAKAHASPSVRKFARELGVDLGRVSGSGVKGRITQDDVKGFVKSALRSGGAPASGGGSLPQVPTVDHAKFGEIEKQKLSRIQKISGPRLQASWINLPHVTQFDKADITDLETVRKALKSDAAGRGIRITPLAFMIKAVVQALREFPQFNSSLDADGEHLILKKYFHVGFAADTPNGLVVPVIRDVDQKDLFQIAEELGTLSQKARDGKLSAADMQGGCFTISSLGSIGGTAFTPIVNAPEVAILGVSKADVEPVWDGQAFQPRTMLPLSLSYDHRVIDGAAAVRFTRFLAETLEQLRELVL